MVAEYLDQSLMLSPNASLIQEKGLSVEHATLLVTLFGLGAAVGGIGGGFLGQVAYQRVRMSEEVTAKSLCLSSDLRLMVMMMVLVV